VVEGEGVSALRPNDDLRGLWVRKGTPALVDSTSPRWGEKASYYSAVCLETGEVEAMHLETTSSAQTSVAFLRQLRATHPEPVIVIWDNSPAHSGDALRQYLATPELRLVHLPAYSPDYNADEAIWDWIRDEVTANICFGTQAKVREHVDAFFHGLKSRVDEVKTRCRTVLQAHVPAPAAM
jgi:transposase